MLASHRVPTSPSPAALDTEFFEKQGLGKTIDENVYREIINHRSLCHPNIIRFKEVILTLTHLMIVMEFVAGGELFDQICDCGRFSEDEARYFFQQLICGVSYCHHMEQSCQFQQMCHRDLKLKNVLLDGSPAPRLKICDFGYSKSSVLHSRPKSVLGTPAYIAPEVLSRREYDGKWSFLTPCSLMTRILFCFCQHICNIVFLVGEANLLIQALYVQIFLLSFASAHM
ncbi:hypothetical protein ABZP36_010993 [Zizania latifolia]